MVVHDGDASPGARQPHQQLGRVGGGAPGRDALPALLAAAAASTASARRCAQQAQRVVLHQRLGLGGCAVSGEVVGRRIEAPANTREPARDERGVVGQVAHAHRDVEVLADQVDAPRRQVELERDGRVAGDEVGAASRRAPGWRSRSASTRAAARSAAPGGAAPATAAASTSSTTWCACSSTLRPKSVTVSLRVVRRSRRSPSALSSAASRRETVDFGQAQALGRAAEAAFVGHAGEEQQVVGFEAHVAADCSITGTMISIYGLHDRLRATIIFDPSPTQPKEPTMNILQINSSARRDGVPFDDASPIQLVAAPARRRPRRHASPCATWP